MVKAFCADLGPQRPADNIKFAGEDAEAGAVKSIASGSSSDGGPRALADRFFAMWKDSIMLQDSRELASLHFRIFCALLLVSNTDAFSANC